MTSRRHEFAKPHRKNLLSYIGYKIDAFSNGNEAMGATAAFAAAYRKAHVKQYAFSPDKQKYGLEAYAGLSGITHKAPEISVRFKGTGPSDSSNKVVTIGANFSENHNNEKNLFSIESDASSYVHLHGDSKEIPSSGVVTLRIKAQAHQEGVPNIDATYAHFYDLTHTASPTEDHTSHSSLHYGNMGKNSIGTELFVGDEIDPQVYGFSANLHSEKCEAKRMMFNLPCARVSFSAKRSPRQQGYFVLQNVGLGCNYRGAHQHFSVHGKQCCSSPLGPLLSPSCYDSSCGIPMRHTMNCSNEDHPYYLETKELSSQNIALSRQPNFSKFNSAFSDMLQQDYKEYWQRMSVVVRHRTAGQLYKTPDSSSRRYHISQITKMVTAISFLKIAESRSISWERIKNDSTLLPELLGTGSPLCNSLAKIFALPDELAEHQHSHYVNSCSGQTMGYYNNDDLNQSVVRWPTMFQLLTETSGLPHGIQISPTNAMLAYESVIKQTFQNTEEEFVTFLDNNPQRLLFAPGSVVHPSHLGYAILGFVIAKMHEGTRTIDQILLETAKQMGMNDCKIFATDEESVKEGFGRNAGIYTPAYGLIASVSDMDSLLQAYLSEGCSLSKYLKRIMMPRFGISDKSPTVQCMGGQLFSPMFHKKTKQLMFTTVDNCGYLPTLGHGVRTAFIPELQLGISFCMEGAPAHIFRKFCHKMIKSVVKCYRKEVLAMPPHVTLCVNRRPGSELVSVCGLPPLYWHTLHSHKVTDSSYSRERTSFVFSTNVSDSAYYSTPCGTHLDWQAQDSRQLSEFATSQETFFSNCVNNAVVFVPLFGALQITEKLIVMKERKSQNYVLQFVPSIPSNLQSEQERSIYSMERTLRFPVIQDPTTGEFRLIREDLPREHLQLHFSLSQRGNPIYGITVLGVPYFIEAYVTSLQGALRKHLEEESSRQSSDIYSVHHKPVFERLREALIGASFAGPLLGGLALGTALGAGVGLASGYPYGGYIDPYPGYVSPIWAPPVVFPRPYYGPWYNRGGYWRGQRIGGYGGPWRGGSRGGGYWGRGRRIRETIEDVAVASKRVQALLTSQ